MKKLGVLLVAGFLLCYGNPATAKEIKAGTWSFSGATNLNYSSSTVDPEGPGKTDTDTFSLELESKYFILPNLGLGLLWNLEDSDEDSFGDNTKTTDYFIGPVVEYQFGLTDQVNLFAAASVGYVSTKTEFTPSGFGTIKNDADGYYYAIKGGAKMFLVDALSVDVDLSYLVGKLQEDTQNIDIDTDEVAVGAGFSVYF